MDYNYYFTANKQVISKNDAVYSAGKRCYSVPINIEALEELSLNVKNQNILVLLERLYEIRNNKKEAKLTDHVFDKRLRQYQNQDIAYMNLLPNPAVFNAPRTGKTPTTLIYIREQGFRKVLIAVPSSIVLVWGQEIKKWLDKEAVIISGTKIKRDKIVEGLKKTDEWIAVISYDTLKICSSIHTLKTDCFVVDEAHFLRNKDTSRSASVNLVGRLAKTRIALTGTPAVKHASDVWYILHFLYPKRFTSYWNFVYRYFKMDVDAYTGNDVPSSMKKHRKNEFLNLMDDLCIERKLHDVLDWMPEVIKYPLVVLDFDKVQSKQYTSMLNEYVASTESGNYVVDVSNTLGKIMRLRQIALDPSLIGLDGKSPKTKWILDYIEDNPEEPLIVFSNFTSYLKKLQNLIPNSCILTGEQTKENKLKNIQDFQNGKSNVILVNTQAGGVGVTLDRASTEIFADFVWSPHEQEQAEARFMPTTKEKNSPRGIYYLFMRNSVDYHMLDRVNIKAKSANYVNNIQQALSDMRKEGIL